MPSLTFSLSLSPARLPSLFLLILPLYSNLSHPSPKTTPKAKVKEITPYGYGIEIEERVVKHRSQWLTCKCNKTLEERIHMMNCCGGILVAVNSFRLVGRLVGKES